MKVYISGEISGLSADEYEDLFNAAEVKLQAEGYDVVNPLRVRVPAEEIDPSRHSEAEIWKAHLRADIKELATCDAVYFLRGWERSEGATLEHAIAKGLRLKIEYAEEPRHREIKDAIQAAMGVSFKKIAADSRNRWHVFARMIYAHHCKKDGDNTQQIAEETRHDQSSICYYLRHYDTEYKFNREFRKAAEKVATLLSRKLAQQQEA